MCSVGLIKGVTMVYWKMSEGQGYGRKMKGEGKEGCYRESSNAMTVEEIHCK